MGTVDPDVGVDQTGRLRIVRSIFCTPGMVMAALGLLQEHPRPTDAEIVRGMDGNICRCGVYPRIVAAIRDAAAAMTGETP